MRIFSFVYFFLCLAVFSQAQDLLYRGSIPEELLRPKQGEAPHFPVDMVIGELGQGKASDAAYSFAKSIASGLISANMEHPGLAGINAALRENFLTVLEEISPRSYRLGGGREEADGAISFLIRFIGKDQGITGELYIRYLTKQTEGADGEIKTTGRWIFEELLLEEARDREVEQKESIYRADFYPYERFY